MGQYRLSPRHCRTAVVETSTAAHPAVGVRRTPSGQKRAQGESGRGRRWAGGGIVVTSARMGTRHVRCNESGRRVGGGPNVPPGPRAKDRAAARRSGQGIGSAKWGTSWSANQAKSLLPGGATTWPRIPSARPSGSQLCKMCAVLPRLGLLVRNNTLGAKSHLLLTEFQTAACKEAWLDSSAKAGGGGAGRRPAMRSWMRRNTCGRFAGNDPYRKNRSRALRAMDCDSCGWSSAS